MCLAATLVRLVQNIDPRDRGVNLALKGIPGGMYDWPFVIDFSELLRDMSNGAVDVDAINAYTVGDFDRVEGLKRSCRYSNFLDPRCRFKDAWFGV